MILRSLFESVSGNSFLNKFKLFSKCFFLFQTNCRSSKSKFKNDLQGNAQKCRKIMRNSSLYTHESVFCISNASESTGHCLHVLQHRQSNLPTTIRSLVRILQFNSFEIDNISNVHLFQRMPFDYENPLGFPIAWSIQCIAVYYSLAVFVTNLSHFTGSCLILVSLATDMESVISTLNVGKESEIHPKEFRNRFFEFIQFYSNAKELSGIKLLILNRNKC